MINRPRSWRYLTAMCLILTGVASGCGEGNKSVATGPQWEAGSPMPNVEKRLRDNPDDPQAYNHFVQSLQVRFAELIQEKQHDQASTLIQNAKLVLNSISPQQPIAKQFHARALDSMQQAERLLAAEGKTREELRKELEANPNSRDHLETYAIKLQMEILPLIHSDAKAAEAAWKSDLEFLAALAEKSTSAEVKEAIELFQTRLAPMFQKQLEQALSHQEMIGSPAPPLAGISYWINSEPLTEEALKGKVVILDFWSVTCGPCVYSIPELEELHQQYAEQGLVVIGVTNHAGLIWSSTAETFARPPEAPTPKQENDMLRHFAKKHQMTYPIAVESGDAMTDAYQVSAIPQMAVIDRQGVVRKIQVGYSPKGAGLLKKLIEELLAK